MDIRKLTRAELANMFDHTNLHADATAADIRKLCTEARENGFKMVAIHPAQVLRCREYLSGSPVHVGACIGFPLGQNTLAVKLYETEQAILEGSDEIDYVINITEVKEGNWAYLEEEMRQITELCHRNNVLCKVIFENCYLTRDEIRKLSEIAGKVGIDFVKTSTGFGTSGAKAEDVALMKEAAGADVQVKAAGGIRSWEDCRAMLEAGATRIGTSASFKILEGFDAWKAEQG